MASPTASIAATASSASLSPIAPPYPAQHHLTDLILYNLSVGSIRRFGLPLAHARVELRRLRPPAADIYQQAYGEQVAFDADVNAISILLRCRSDRAHRPKECARSDPAGDAP